MKKNKNEIIFTDKETNVYLSNGKSITIHLRSAFTGIDHISHVKGNDFFLVKNYSQTNNEFNKKELKNEGIVIFEEEGDIENISKGFSFKAKINTEDLAICSIADYSLSLSGNKKKEQKEPKGNDVNRLKKLFSFK